MDELAGLSEETRKLAMERFRLLKPHIENDEPLTTVARADGIPYRTAHRLVSEYRRIGLTALVRKKRTDRGERRVVSGKLNEAIEGLALQKPLLTIAALYPAGVKAFEGTRPEDRKLRHRVRYRPKPPSGSCHAGARRHQGVQQHF